jgi:DNA-binding NtrC family response regulator
MKILLIEDEKISRITLSDTLRKDGYEVTACETGSTGLAEIQTNFFDVVITDLRLPQANGLDLLKAAKAKAANCTVIVITAYATVETAVTALKMGAYDYLTKPFSPDKLLSMLRNVRQFHEIVAENSQLKEKISRFENRTLIGNAPSMRRLFQTIAAVANRDHTVLIEGESGTGKELVARALHRQSYRGKNQFVAVNCAAVPESLFESELFGHEKGAFTGANRLHQGYLERAHQGTLFIDDIDDFPYLLQVKLLRALQEKEIQRVGGQEVIPVDARVICASKVDLRTLVPAGKFREDLYYRLNIIILKIPPLRERKEDIPLLIEHFLAKHSDGDQPKTLRPDQLEKFLKYPWPGNVRELENTIERMLALPDGDEFMEFLLEPAASVSMPSNNPKNEFEGHPSLVDYLVQQETQRIQWALETARNNISEAARLLKIPRSTLRSKMEKLGEWGN